MSDDMAHISLCLDRKDELFIFSNQPFFCHHLPLPSPVCPCVSHLTGPQDAAVALAEARSDWLICVMSFTSKLATGQDAATAGSVLTRQLIMQKT